MQLPFDSTDLIPLAVAAELVPGKRHPATIWRWINFGLAGVQLDALEVGGVTYTTRRALQEFFEAVTAAKRGR